MFKNREHAGELLAEKLEQFRGSNSLVLGIPRGGVVVAAVIAKRLLLPLDIVVVKKIGSLYNPELAIGAVGPEKTVFWDNNLIDQLGINSKVRNENLKMKNEERIEREKLLRGNNKPPILKNKTVILVDDGIATGATVKVSAIYLRKKKVKELLLAAPVISNDTFRSISKYFDRMVFLDVSSFFESVGQFYQEFSQVSDENVMKLINSR